MTADIPADPIEIVRHPRARRTKLAFDRVTGRARLTIPPRASATRALAWARGQAAWIEQQRERLPQSQPFVSGAAIPWDDGTLTIRWQEEAPRMVRREGDMLILGGPADSVPRRIEAWLRRAALALLTADTTACAAKAGVTVAGVAIGDARGRWGSCASTGTIRYNWRLAMAPRRVRLATVAHEVAHRVHMNHGADFHALVAQLHGADATPERQWLRRHGAALHWIGRSA